MSGSVVVLDALLMVALPRAQVLFLPELGTAELKLLDDLVLMMEVRLDMPHTLPDERIIKDADHEV